MDLGFILSLAETVGRCGKSLCGLQNASGSDGSIDPVGFGRLGLHGTEPVGNAGPLYSNFITPCMIILSVSKICEP